MARVAPNQDVIVSLVLWIGGILFLAVLVVIGLLFIGQGRGRALLARRWSAAHVLLGFQAWLFATIAFELFAAAVWAALDPRGAAAAFADTAWMRPIFLLTLLVQNVAMVAVVLFAVTVSYDQRLVAAGLSARSWKPKAAIGFLSAAIVLPLNVGLEQLSVLVVRHLHFASLVQRQYESEFARLLSMFRGTGGLVGAILLIGLLAPFCEEVFFRGFAYRCFRKRWGPTVGMLCSAALFAAIHLHPVGLLPIFVVGCALALLYERTGTLVAPFALHATNNIVAVLLVHFSQGR